MTFGRTSCVIWIFTLTLGQVVLAADNVPGPLRGLILITVDTLRADHVGGYGELGLTPNIDALAARGAWVERMSTPMPSTGPAHASLFTGHHPWRHGVTNNAVPFNPPEGQALAEILRDGGFETAGFVSSYVLDPRFQFDRGFQEYVFKPTLSYSWRGEHVKAFWARGEETSRSAIQWLTKHASGDERFFLWVHYFDPHSPYDPPGQFSFLHNAAVDMTSKSVPRGVGSLLKLRDLIHAYRGEVRYVDRQIGKLVNRAQILGLDEDVAIVLTSDHGEGLGDHGHLEHGRNLHGELVRVPLVVVAPGVAAGQQLAGAAQLEDLFPTVLSLLGVRRAVGGDGVDLTPWLRGQSPVSPRKVVYGQRQPYDDMPDYYYRDEWPAKWVGSLETGGIEYELDVDTGERAGVGGRGAPSDLVRRVETDAAAKAGKRDLDEDSERALRALGYIE